MNLRAELIWWTLVKWIVLGRHGAQIETINWNNDHKEKAALWWQFDITAEPVCSGELGEAAHTIFFCYQASGAAIICWVQAAAPALSTGDTPVTEAAWQVPLQNCHIRLA